MLRVGRIPYLNCEPFFHRLTGVELVDLIPRRLGEAMAACRLDAGPLSLIDYLRIESELTPLPYGIGCPTGARSVLVFSDRPLSGLRGARVGITGETSTSVELRAQSQSLGRGNPRAHAPSREDEGQARPLRPLGAEVGDARVGGARGERPDGRVTDQEHGIRRIVDADPGARGHLVLEGEQHAQELDRR